MVVAELVRLRAHGVLHERDPSGHDIESAYNDLRESHGNPAPLASNRMRGSGHRMTEYRLVKIDDLWQQEKLK